MDSRTRYIPAIVMLSAGFVSCVITILQKYSTKEVLLISTGVMVLFLIVGFIIKFIVDKYIVVNVTEEITEEVETDKEETNEEKGQNDIADETK